MGTGYANVQDVSVREKLVKDDLGLVPFTGGPIGKEQVWAPEFQVDFSLGLDELSQT